MLGQGPGQALEALWREAFGRARPGSRVLEIGCGSGHVSLWAAEASRRLEVIASDIHDHPEFVRPHPDLAFLPNAPAEALPLPSAVIDMVVSNFALEYSPALDRAASEVLRVLRPGGSAVLVIHSDDSAVTDSSRRLLDVIARIVEADIPGRIGRAAALRPDHLTRRKLLKDVLKLRGSIPDRSTGLQPEAWFDVAERLLRKDPKARNDAQALEEQMAEMKDMAEAHLAAALDRTAVARLQAQFERLGAKAVTSEITGQYDRLRVDKFAWLMSVAKPLY
jgi:SAM-dependent methyltransferase